MSNRDTRLASKLDRAGDRVQRAVERIGTVELADVIAFLNEAAETVGSTKMGKMARALEKARKVLSKASTDVEKAIELVADVANDLDPEDDPDNLDDDEDEDDDFDEDDD